MSSDLRTSFKKIMRLINTLMPFATARVIPASLNLIAIPIILRNTGADTFGLITIILSFLAIQAIADLGVINSFLPIFVRKLQNNDLEEAKSIYLSTIIRIFCSSSLFLALSVPAVMIFLRKANTESYKEIITEFNFTIYILAFSTILAGLVPFTNCILLVFEKNRLSSILNSISNSAVALIMIVTSFMEAPIVPMTFGIVFTPIIISICTLIWISKKNDLFSFNSFKWHFSYFGFRTQFGNWIIQVSAILSVQFDAIILSLYSDSSEVARYGVIAKVFLFVVTIYSWATAQENIDTIKIDPQGGFAKVDNDSIRFIRRLVIYTSVVIIPLAVILRPVLGLLSGKILKFSYFEIVISITWCLSLLVTTKISRILFAKGIYSGYFQISMLVSLVNLAVTFLLCSLGLGMLGPLIATIFSSFLVYLPCFLYLHRRNSPR